MPRIGSLIALALAACLWPAASAHAAPSYGLSIVRVGSPQQSVLNDLDLAKDAGMKIVRTELPWFALEPEAPEVTDQAVLDALDALVQAADARGLKVQLTIDGSPCWASSAPAAERQDCGPDARPGRYSPWPPADVQQFARVAAFVAARYAPSLAGIELWNEPDQASQDYFKGSDKPRRYAALVKAAYPAIKAAAPDVQVLAGSIVGANGTFLQHLYSEGMKGSYDGLAVHYYDLTLASLRAIHQVQRKHGDRAPLWLTEFGWSSCAPKRIQGGQTCVTSKVAGQNLGDMVRALRKTSWVKAAVVYTAHDNGQYDFGLETAAGTRKHAFTALREELAHVHAVRPVSLSLRRSRGRVVLSASGPAADAYGLEVRVAGRLRYTATVLLDARNRLRLTLPGAVGTYRVSVTLKHYWTGRCATRRLG